METFFLVVFSFVVLIIVLAIARVAFTFILEIVGRGLLPFLIVRFITFTMEHWMGSTIAWTLSIIAALWGMYPKVKQLFTDPHSFIKESRERDDRVARDRAEFNQWYNSQRKSTSDSD